LKCQEQGVDIIEPHPHHPERRMGGREQKVEEFLRERLKGGNAEAKALSP
jgi:hypothetical protein